MAIRFVLLELVLDVGAEVIRLMKEEEALLEGRFLLASGRISDYYIRFEEAYTASCTVPGLWLRQQLVHQLRLPKKLILWVATGLQRNSDSVSHSCDV